MDLLRMRNFIVGCAFFMLSITCFGAPAYPGKIVYRQPDGKLLTVFLRGDENFHFYESEDSVVLLPDSAFCLRYATIASDGSVVPGKYVASNTKLRTEQERLYISTLNQAQIRNGLADEFRIRRQNRLVDTYMRRSVSPGEIKNTFPTTGDIRGVIILAEFTDVKFSSQDVNIIYDKMANDESYAGPYASGSIRKYFLDQSGGLFSPSFDVVGPVELPHDMAYYGVDEKAAELMIDACIMADKTHGVDFSKYDCNQDGYVDFVFVVYAGYGQAQGGSEETVWPQAVDLTYESWSTFDGLYLSQAACSCELKGNSGQIIDGIGTFCHEFSHILGLPDIYDPMYSGLPGMLNWDIMDKGLYNDDGMTPAGYTAMDKYTVGWLEPEILETPVSGCRLRPLSEQGNAYFIVCGTDNNEYYTLENRQQTGWDKGLDGHGLIISHIHYVPSLWAGNRVNTTSSGYEHVALVPADNNPSYGTEAGDPFPGTGGNTSFTDTSLPGASWHTSDAPVGCPVTNIREEGGMIIFDFKCDASGIDVPHGEKASVSVCGKEVRVHNPAHSKLTVATSDGQLVCNTYGNEVIMCLDEGIYIVRCGELTKKIVIR